MSICVIGADLKWARGQEEFSRLEEKFHSHGAATAMPAAAPVAAVRAAASPEKESDLQIDESQIPSLRSLGLDDDDTPVARVQPVAAAPQPPQEPPPPPMAWQQHHQQQQPPAPPLPPHMNAGGNNQPPLPPPPPNAWNQHQNNGHHPPYLPPPMGAMPPHQMRGLQPPMPPPPFMHGQYPNMPPPRGMPYPPPPPPFYMGGPPPPPQFGRGGPMPGPAFKMMTPRDINFVVQQQMKQIRTSDPFSDDYYFHNHTQKRTRGGAPSAGPAPGTRPGLPLPSWKLEHVKSFDPRDAQRENKSRNWEQEYHVLGRNTKSSLYRPKQMLNLGGSSSNGNTSGGDDAEPEQAASATGESSSGTEAADNAKEERSPTPPPSSAEHHVLRMSGDASRNSVFANDTWHRRQQIDRGMQCLLSLQDARHILDARGVNVQQFHSMDEQAMDPALAELRARTTALLLELAGLLGVAVTTNEQAEQPAGVMSCDASQLFMMLDTSKGRKLVSRSLPLLHPSARFVLLPLVVEHMLGARTVSRLASGNALADESDDRLCQALVLIILYHPPAPSAELLAECLQRALEGHNVQTLAVVLHNRARAEALQALLQRGGAAVQQLSTAEGDGGRYMAVKNRWEHSQGVFVSLATAIKQSA